MCIGNPIFFSCLVALSRAMTAAEAGGIEKIYDATPVGST